jgi:hypothetical protein
MRRGLALWIALAAACSDVRLEYPEDETAQNAVDNELSISGQFCTSTAGDVEYPVKIMFIVDGSGSQQFTDQNRQRVVAVSEAVNALIGVGNTYFKVVVFNASVTATPTVATDCATPVFTNSIGDLTNALNNMAEADSLTDYQGALGVAYQELKTDMGCVWERSPAELGRTKYVIIFISDGMPDPQCTIGLGNDFDPVNPTQPYLLCENVNYANCLLQRDLGDANGTQCGFTDAATGSAFCKYPGDCDCSNQAACGCCFDQADAHSGLFGNFQGVVSSDYAGGEDYNQPYQILQKVEEIMELQDRYQVGELRIHAGLVFDPLADPTVIEIFGDAAQAAPLMQQVADTGNGQYMEFYGGDQIDFLSINFQSIKQQRVIRGFFADNRANRMAVSGLLPDTDFDGLTDQEEDEVYGTNPTYADSDHDGYSDLVEVRMLGFSFDPLDECYPPIDDRFLDYRTRTESCADAKAGGRFYPCRDEANFGCQRSDGTCTDSPPHYFADVDRDGLHDCEEMALGTNPTHPDTDHDGMPDLQELTFGTNARGWDFDSDFDKDTIPNGRELEWHLNPILQQSDQDARARYRYDRPEISQTIDGRSCFEFSVRRIQLAYTQRNMDLPVAFDGVGFNEIRLYLLENMADNLSGAPLIRTACVRAQYIPPTLKVPSSGEVVLPREELLPPQSFWYLGNQEDPMFTNFKPENNNAKVQLDPITDCIAPQL